MHSSLIFNRSPTTYLIQSPRNCFTPFPPDVGGICRQLLYITPNSSQNKWPALSRLPTLRARILGKDTVCLSCIFINTFKSMRSPLLCIEIPRWAMRNPRNAGALPTCISLYWQEKQLLGSPKNARQILSFRAASDSSYVLVCFTAKCYLGSTPWFIFSSCFSFSTQKYFASCTSLFFP